MIVRIMIKTDDDHDYNENDNFNDINNILVTNLYWKE